MNPKFKIGDKVAVIMDRNNRLSPNSKDYPPIGSIVTIKTISGYFDPVFWFEEYANGRFTEELEFADIYNSPLYQALRED